MRCQKCTNKFRFRRNSDFNLWTSGETSLQHRVTWVHVLPSKPFPGKTTTRTGFETRRRTQRIWWASITPSTRWLIRKLEACSSSITPQPTRGIPEKHPQRRIKSRSSSFWTKIWATTSLKWGRLRASRCHRPMSIKRCKIHWFNF